MGLKLITAPAVEPVLLADVKAQLGIPTADTAHDDVITRRITEAREWAEIYTNRAFITQTVELALDAFPAAEIDLPRGPVTGITSVKYLDDSQMEQTLDAATYTLDDYGPQPWLLPAYGQDWPTTLDAANAVKIRYVCGYGGTGASVPGPIKEAILLTVGHWMNFQPGVESGVSITRIPYAVECLLSPYRLYTFG